MKKLFFLCILLGLAYASQAQQDEHYTQFMYNKLGYNPAYAGIPETGTFNLLYRNQWLGFEGGPQTQLLTFNTPISSTGIGLGGLISRHTIGITERYTAEAAYTYRFNLGVGGRLGIGLSSSVRLLRVDYSKARAVEPIPTDGAIPASLQSKYVPNFGAGIYYSNPTFYFGLSAPRLLENNIDLSDEQTVISREVRHFYAMGGITFPLGDKLKLQPQALLKFVKAAPFDADANLNVILNDRIFTGISYRIGGSRETGVGESAGVIFGMQLTSHLEFGLSYDFTMSELRSYQNGSVEGAVRYLLGGRSEGETILNPRLF